MATKKKVPLSRHLFHRDFRHLTSAILHQPSDILHGLVHAQPAIVVSAALAPLATWRGVGGEASLRRQDETDGRLVLEPLLLAVHHALDALHHVAGAEHALVLQGTRGQLLALHVLRSEVHVDALDERVQATLHGCLHRHGTVLLTLNRGTERAQALQLHGLSLEQRNFHQCRW